MRARGIPTVNQQRMTIGNLLIMKGAIYVVPRMGLVGYHRRILTAAAFDTRHAGPVGPDWCLDSYAGLLSFVWVPWSRPPRISLAASRASATSSFVPTSRPYCRSIDIVDPSSPLLVL